MSRTTNMLLARIFTGIILAGFYMTANTASAATPTPKFDGTTYSSMKQNGRTIVVDGHLNTFVQKDGNVYEYIGTIDPATMNKSDPKPANQTKSDKSGTASQKSAEQHITKSTLYKNVELNNLDQAKRLIQHDYRTQIDLGSCVKKTNVWIGGKYQDTLTCDDKINGGKIQFEFDDLSEKKNALNETVYQKLQNYLCKKVDKNLTYEDDTCMKDLETIWGNNVPRKPAKVKYPKSVDVKNIPVTKAGAEDYVENYQKNKDMNLTDCQTNVEEHNIVCKNPDKTSITFNFDKEFIDLDYFKDREALSQEEAQKMVRTKYKDCTGTGYARPNIITCTMWGGKNNKQKFEFEFEFKKIEQPKDESEEAEEDEEEEETLETPEESAQKSDAEEDEKENERQQDVDAEKILAQMEADARTILDAYEEKMTELNEKYHQ